LLSSLLRCPDCGQGMVPSITTYTRKDGTKRKHRYYVCGNFHNKGSSACKANSIKAFEAEEIVIKRIGTFVSNKKCFFKRLQELNSISVDSLSNLKQELEQVDIRIDEINQLQERYMEAFEKNTLPISILQERLQKVSKEKGDLEQRKKEITAQLDSTDTKIIQPELIEMILSQFLSVYETSSRENQKHLLQLLINKITIKQSMERSRSINKIELDFDFTEINISKTFTLIHMLYRETDNEADYLQPIPASDNKIPPYLQLFLPLFMIRFPTINPKRTINLLDEDQAHELVWEGHA
jgi:site-specific DNA recombinase